MKIKPSTIQFQLALTKADADLPVKEIPSLLNRLAHLTPTKTQPHDEKPPVVKSDVQVKTKKWKGVSGRLGESGG